MGQVVGIGEIGGRRGREGKGREGDDSLCSQLGGIEGEYLSKKH